MLKLRVVQALFGDCLILENEVNGSTHYILIDGGPGNVYKPYLRGELQRIVAAGGKLGLLVLSHVDNDHVLGLLELMAELKLEHDNGLPPLIQIDQLWHNAFGKFLVGPDATPADQAAAESLEQEMMSAPDEPQAAPDQPQAAPDELLAAPGEQLLLPALAESDPLAAPTEPAAQVDPLATPADDWALQAPVDYGFSEGNQLQMTDGALGIPRNTGFPDGLITLEDSPRPEPIAGLNAWILGPEKANLERLRVDWVKWLRKEGLPFGVPGGPVVKPDDSETNLSSIMFLAEADGRRILLTGDGLGDDILAGLEQTGQLLPGGTCHVDIFKLPHHGSARNSGGALFDRVLADVYVISANGRYSNPDIQTLTSLVDAACRQGRDIQIFATNPAPALDQILKLRPPQTSHYRLTIMDPGASSALL